MMRTILLVMTVLIFGVVSPAHTEFIGIFKDTSGCSCMLYDTAQGLMTVTILHVNSPGATGSRFAAPQSHCMRLTWIMDTPVFPATIGSSQEGLSIGYGQCRTGTFHIFTITYFAQGLTPECCYYDIRPNPEALSGQVEAFDCDYQVVPIIGGSDIINATAECWCPPPPDGCYPVAVESSTWGQIKALYFNN